MNAPIPFVTLLPPQPNLPSIESVLEAEEPTKCLVINKTLEVNCSVEFVSFEGRSDGMSKKNILSQIAPRKLILVHASDADMGVLTVPILSFCSDLHLCWGGGWGSRDKSSSLETNC